MGRRGIGSMSMLSLSRLDFLACVGRSFSERHGRMRMVGATRWLRQQMINPKSVERQEKSSRDERMQQWKRGNSNNQWEGKVDPKCETSEGAESIKKCEPFEKGRHRREEGTRRTRNSKTRKQRP